MTNPEESQAFYPATSAELDGTTLYPELYETYPTLLRPYQREALNPSYGEITKPETIPLRQSQEGEQ